MEDEEVLEAIQGTICIPKTLGDIIESITAALYLDTKDIEVVWKVLKPLLQPEIGKFF